MIITLTPEQLAAIHKPLKDEAIKTLAFEARKADRKLATAKAQTDHWKSSYQTTRKNLLKAQAEIKDLKRRLRNGEFE